MGEPLISVDIFRLTGKDYTVAIAVDLRRIFARPVSGHRPSKRDLCFSPPPRTLFGFETSPQGNRCLAAFISPVAVSLTEPV